MLLRYITLRNTYETCEASFRSKQVVIRIVRTKLGDVVADGKELAIVVQQKGKIVLGKERVAGLDQATQSFEQITRSVGRCFALRCKLLQFACYCFWESRRGVLGNLGLQ